MAEDQKTGEDSVFPIRRRKTGSSERPAGDAMDEMFAMVYMVFLENKECTMRGTIGRKRRTGIIPLDCGIILTWCPGEGWISAPFDPVVREMEDLIIGRGLRITKGLLWPCLCDAV